MFTFVYGRIPFNAPNVFKLFQVVQTEPLRFPEDVPTSDDLKDLLTKMLAKVRMDGAMDGNYLKDIDREVETRSNVTESVLRMTFAVPIRVLYLIPATHPMPLHVILLAACWCRVRS